MTSRRSYAVENRTVNDWRLAFAKYGGSARQLLVRKESELEEDLKTAIRDCDPSALFQQTLTTEPDKYSHRLAEINPIQDDNGLIPSRSDPYSKIISFYIFDQLLEKKKDIVIKASEEKFMSLLKQPTTRTVAGYIFEDLGHIYIVKLTSEKRPLFIRALEDQAPEDPGPEDPGPVTRARTRAQAQDQARTALARPARARPARAHSARAHSARRAARVRAARARADQARADRDHSGHVRLALRRLSEDMMLFRGSDLPFGPNQQEKDIKKKKYYRPILQLR